MLSIQIDTNNLELVIGHKFNNIKSSFFASHMKLIFHYICLIDDVRVLDTLVGLFSKKVTVMWCPINFCTLRQDNENDPKLKTASLSTTVSRFSASLPDYHFVLVFQAKVC